MKLIWVYSIGYGREDTSPNKFCLEPRFTEPYMGLCTLHHQNLSHLNDKNDLYVLLFPTKLKAH
jgi:hypothetical protein